MQSSLLQLQRTQTVLAIEIVVAKKIFVFRLFWIAIQAQTESFLIFPLNQIIPLQSSGAVPWNLDAVAELRVNSPLSEIFHTTSSLNSTLGWGELAISSFSAFPRGIVATPNMHFTVVQKSVSAFHTFSVEKWLHKSSLRLKLIFGILSS